MDRTAKRPNGTHASPLTRVTVVALVAVVAMALTAPAFAGPKPVILATHADLGAGTLTIQGANFGNGVPVVTLASQPLVVQQSSPTEIVAALPPGLTEGSYLLGVGKTSKAEVTSVVTLDVDAVSDGPGREIQHSASATDGGPNPAATTQFLGAPTTITTTKANQYALVIASNAFGTSAASANGLNLFICYQATSGQITTVGNGILGLRLPAVTRVTQLVHKIIQLPAAGTYTVGMCGNTTSANWNDNDWGMTSALVF
jgi:hypothetical protein